MGGESGAPALQCVAYARLESGIQIFGDALTWWEQAEGQYERGYRPEVGGVMAFAPYGPMKLGHVAVVSRIIDRRTVLLRHANWSPFGGVRGWIENDVPAIDASPDNNWSAVRVWFAPTQRLGSTAWPVQGFIYNRRVRPLARRMLVSRSDDPIGAIIARQMKEAAYDREVASIRPRAFNAGVAGPDSRDGLRRRVSAVGRGAADLVPQQGVAPPVWRDLATP
nr:CHAP domain-containing protein [Sphingobium yanoikuyae]